MCGIFGFKNLDLEIKKIEKELYHRGPDGFGIKQQKDVTFCHCRLAIVDPSNKALQPMESNGNMIIFNGEIYNYKELKEEYLKDIEFISLSDTEVLLKLIEKYGLKILNKLNGMFAFAYYNKETESIFLVNDRYGIKQLFYYIQDNKIAFSSEDSVLMKVLNIPFKFNQSYIETLYIKDIDDFERKLINENIHSVKAGEYIEITKDNQIKKNKYYYFNDFDIKSLNIDYRNKKNVINYFEELLTDSIKLRCNTNLPIAMTLSGGTDSTLIYTLIKEKLGNNITAFTYSNQNEKKDEYNLVEKLVKKYNDKVIKLEYDNEKFKEDYENALIALNAPCCISDAGYYSVYKRIKEKNFKVLLEGHGADEILGGYPTYFIPAIKQAILENKLLLALNILNIHKLNRTVNITPKEIQSILKCLLRIEKTNPKIYSQCIHYLTTKYPLPKYLRYFDRLTMANSIESRNPFLDYRIVEFARALPLEYKVNRIGNKAILREILKKYKIDFIHENKIKRGFTTSEEIAIKNNKDFLLKYYNQKRFNLDTSNFDNNIYKACSVGFLENYYANYYKT